MQEIKHEQLMEAYRKLPYPVREYLVSEQFGTAMRSLEAKFGLHIDVVGSISETVQQMLMGFIAPTELLREMQRTGIEGAKATEVIRELNEHVFKPLHQKMREGERVPAPPQTPVPAPLGRPEPPAPTITTPVPPAPVEPVAVIPEPETKTRESGIVDPLPVYEPLPRRDTPRPYISPDISGLPTPPPPKSYARDPYREPIE